MDGYDPSLPLSLAPNAAPLGRVFSLIPQFSQDFLDPVGVLGRGIPVKAQLGERPQLNTGGQGSAYIAAR